MILTNADRHRMMTPSGRLTPPIPQSGSPGVPATQSPVNASEFAQVTIPKLDATFIQNNGTVAIPWYQTLINLYRINQKTGVIPGTYNGMTINAFGQVTSATASGATIDSPDLTGRPTAPTQPANDNSNAVATTAFVHSQGYLTGNQNITLSGDVSGSGATAIAATVIALQHRAVSAAAPAVGQALIWNGSAWTPGQAGIPDAPADGQRYVRQNNQWVVIVSP